MSYRDDLDAAHARNSDLERQIVALERRQVGLEPPRRGGIGAVIGVVTGLGVALTAAIVHVTWAVPIGAVIVAMIAAGGLQPSIPPDRGPYSIRREVTAPTADGDRRFLVIAMITLAPVRGGPVLTRANQERVGEIVGGVVEGVLRGRVQARTAAELRQAGDLGEDVRVAAAAAVERYGLALDALFVSLA